MDAWEKCYWVWKMALNLGQVRLKVQVYFHHR
jgi:hypothetical protein